MRTLAEMRWKKEPDFASLLSKATLQHRPPLPYERLWHKLCAMRGKPSGLPVLTPPAAARVRLMVYAALHQQEGMRRERAELVWMTTGIVLTNTIVRGCTPRDADPSLTPKQVDHLLTLLHNVQSITNPLAIRPQSQAADALDEQMESLKQWFGQNPTLVVQTLD